MELDLVKIDEIDQLISNKGFSSILDRHGKVVSSNIFSLFEILNSEDQYTLIKELINRFILIRDYEKYARKISSFICDLFGGEEIVIVPVNDEKGSIKSGHAFAYDISIYIDKRKFKNFDMKEGNFDKIKNSNKKIFIVVDDFVGSGSQAKAFLRKYQDAKIFNKENCYIFSIASMERARSRLSNYCVDIYSEIYLRRCISDYLGDFTAKDPLAVYSEIEKMLKLKSVYRFGYLKSESLISLKRTPNNTLPIFWSENGLGGKWPAIFPR